MTINKKKSVQISLTHTPKLNYEVKQLYKDLTIVKTLEKAQLVNFIRDFNVDIEQQVIGILKTLVNII